MNAEALMREHILQAIEQIRGRTAPPVTDPVSTPRTGPAAHPPALAD